MKSTRLLVIGHGLAATGFSRVADGIIRNLPDDYEVHHLAANHTSSRVSAPWNVYGNPYPDDIHALARGHELCCAIKPDIVLVIGDLWFSGLHVSTLKTGSGSPRCIAYCPIDGELLQADYIKLLTSFDTIVPYNQFGKQQLLAYAHRVNLPNEFQTKTATVIAHGVDKATFYPLNGDATIMDRSLAKAKLFGKNSDLKDSFIVFNGNKHQVRKRLDLTIDGFARFARNKPKNVRLYLHTSAQDQGPDIRLLAHHYGVADRLIVSEGFEHGHPAVGDDLLNLIYNACDVGINTSTGEGWGLISFEHAATGAPQLVPCHSACAELWLGSAIMLKPVATQEHEALGMLRHLVDPQTVAEALERLYSDQDYRQKMAGLALARARAPDVNWHQIGQKWHGLLAAQMGRRRTVSLETSLLSRPT